MTFLRKLVQAYSLNTPLSQLFPRLFLSNVPTLESLKSVQISSTGSFEDMRREGSFYLDKTHFIPKIEARLAPAILSLRPRRFGKTLFLSTLSSYYDVKNRDRFEQLFQDLYIGRNPTPLASKFLVLNLNFSGLLTSQTYEIFTADFHEKLNSRISKFMYKYKQELGEYFRDIDEKRSALANFAKLLDMVDLSNNKLYVCIDEYDASMNQALRNDGLFQALTNHHKTEGDFTRNKLELIESSFKQFFSGLKTACDEGIARCFLTGVTPVIMAEFTSGFNISDDLALNEEFWDLYGFKSGEIEILLDKAFGNDVSNDVKQKVMLWLTEENNGYFFHRNQPQGIFNTARVLYCIKNLKERKKYLNKEHDKCTTVDLNTLLNFLPDPHTLPAQTTLDLIVNNPLGKSILTEALNQHLNSPKGIEQRFRLSNIRELATDRTPLLSFMFYSGAITYQPNPSHSSFEHNFQIPNRVAEREFVVEALKMYDWQKEDLVPVRNCLQILEAEHNIEPLCRFIENNLLKPLKDNSVKHSNEEALKQAFMDTLILTLYHADIKPEFQVSSRSSYFGKAIDLVKTSTGKMIAIEFDNIKMENIILDGAQGSWQEATAVSRSLLEKSEDEILNLEISDRYRSKQKTVQQALEFKIEKKKSEYLESLKTQHDAKLSCMFVVLRVGLHRLISRRIYTDELENKKRYWGVENIIIT
ncbi:unnamed protein product [Rhizophagus irregularis]|uniref:DUF1703-domain-containing protein n=1 Tax=Rhizophagus irregularis TaxID=588596 RepID=A0A2I1HEX5_9GLOM|nr:DUF1703-domain-containing protein [Rhizophagus irregularis]CAB4438676.1 unnamed protein product [Rhizophagus irregularis]